MSQHLINDFIHRTTIFKPLTGEKLNNKKLVKYQASNRKNNTSPQDVAVSVYDLKSIKKNDCLEEDETTKEDRLMTLEKEDSTQEDEPSDAARIDITV